MANGGGVPPAGGGGAIAASIVSFLEPRKVLYDDHEVEIVPEAIGSVREIEDALGQVIQGQHGADPRLVGPLNLMRDACIAFRGRVQLLVARGRIRQFIHQMDHKDAAIFGIALGLLRGEFGPQIEALVDQYGVQITGQLKSILPSSNAAGSLKTLTELQQQYPIGSRIEVRWGPRKQGQPDSVGTIDQVYECRPMGFNPTVVCVLFKEQISGRLEAAFLNEDTVTVVGQKRGRS